MGVGDTFHPTPVGVFFGGPAQPAGRRRSPTRTSAAPARDRTGCIDCGECMTGCRHNAKNTLVKNYLYLAEQNGADGAPADHGHPRRARGAGGGYEVARAVHQGQAAAASAHRTLHRRAGGLRGRARSAPRSCCTGCGTRATCPGSRARLGELTRTNSEAILGAHRRRTLTIDYTQGVAITSSFHPDEHTHIEPVPLRQGQQRRWRCCRPC